MKTVTDERGGPGRGSAKRKTAGDERYAYTKEAGIEREGMARSRRSALPTEGMGEKPEAGYWDGMDPGDSTHAAQNKSQYGVFDKEGGSGPTVIKPGRDFSRGGDPRSLNQSGVYAEKDAGVWKKMAESTEGKDAEWCGTPSDETCEIVGAPMGASKRADGETAPTGKEGQHWRGEPRAENPKVRGEEEGPSGQHWRGEELPSGRKGGADKEARVRSPAPERPDEC